MCVDEALADLDALRVGLEVVFAIGQGESALGEAGDGAVGILGVRRAPKLNSTPIPMRCRRTSSATTSGICVHGA